MSNSGDAAASAAGRSIVLGGTGPSPAISTCLRPGRAARIAATLRSYNRALVTSTRASPSSIRSRIGSGPNAGNSGQNTLVFFSVPRAVKYSSGTRPSSENTRSPLPTPRLRSRFANRFVSARKSR